MLWLQLRCSLIANFYKARTDVKVKQITKLNMHEIMTCPESQIPYTIEVVEYNVAMFVMLRRRSLGTFILLILTSERFKQLTQCLKF